MSVTSLGRGGADDNRVVRIPGQWEFDRIAARHPELYGPITRTRRQVKPTGAKRKEPAWEALSVNSKR